MGAGPADFVDAAKAVVPGTVHVVANGDSWQGVVSGSGAIISADGYIVTNNHVIDGARSIMVTLSNRKMLRATVIGADPNTDVAVLKIDALNLPFLLYGNSDDVKVGQWVLAVGYPLYLQVTATAGIVSAIGRNLGASLGHPPGGSAARIDSFIQTDAAVNLGNSGGPLVNTAGQLVGVNTAMATPNGAYTGYSFAIPVNMVRRVVNEIIAHGAVKKE
jgi:S1-C subfamily serine protease